MPREQRLVFGEDAALYDRARPSYPSALIDDVTRLDGLDPSSCWAADVGCGTGKATAMLAAAGVSGVGIEADPAMAALAEQRVAALGTWRIDRSGFEQWQPQPDDRPFDLVTSAQAWHWVDPATRFVLAYEHLRPGGWLALWWNRGDGNDDPIRAELDEIYERLAPRVPSNYGETSTQRTMWDPPPVGFGTAHERRYPWVRTYTAVEWTDLMRTQSDHRLMDDGERERLLTAVGETIERHGGTYDHHYVCRLWAARRA